MLALFLLLAPCQTVDITGKDKVLHFSAALVITDAGWAAAGAVHAPLWARAATGIGLGVAASLAKEGIDLLGYGTPSFGDLAYDAFGIAAGVGYALAVEALLNRSAEPADK